MQKRILLIVKQSLLSILPLALMVLFFSFTGIVSLDGVDMIRLLIGAILLVVGMVLFNLGVNSSMITMGEFVGSTLTKVKRIVVVILILFLIGFLITAAEPALAILAKQVPIEDMVFIIFVSIGSAIFTIIGIFRIIYNKSIKEILMVGYALVFLLVALSLSGYIPMSFDASGVTTGIVTVPFILALGKGVASSKKDHVNQDDSFGLVGIVCIGPIIFVLIMGMIAGVNPEVVTSDTVPITNMFLELMNEIGSTAFSVLIILIPILFLFFVYQFFLIKLTKKKIIKILMASSWLFLGLVIFLSGASFGYLGAAKTFGESLATKESLALVLLIVTLLGFTSVLSEPSVHVLGEQVEDFSDGVIKKNTLVFSLAIGVAISLILSIIRIEFQIPAFVFLGTGFFIALLLSLFVPSIYTAIAFDSGGAVSGAITASFIVPMISGFALHTLGEGSLAEFGLGAVGLVAMMPLIIIQLLGLEASIRERYSMKLARRRIKEEGENQIVYFDEEEV